MQDDDWIQAIEMVTEATRDRRLSWTQSGDDITHLLARGSNCQLAVSDASADPEMTRFLEISEPNGDTIARIEMISVVEEVVNPVKYKLDLDEAVSAALVSLLSAVEDSRKPDPSAQRDRVFGALDGI